MKKTKIPNKRIMGYTLRINRTGERGDWERVGYLYGSKDEAREAKDRYWTGATRFIVEAVRLSTKPVGDKDEA